jgi:hypothetical protein
MSIEAMKQALEALEALNKVSIGVDAVCLPGEIDTAMDALRQSIEQAEKQEPVAWMIWLHGPAGLLEHKQLAELEFERRNKEYPDENRKLLPLYTTPQPQEFVCSTGLCHYTQPQREWQGLTDDEVTQQVGDSQVLRDVARAVEHVLKEKNT